MSAWVAAYAAQTFGGDLANQWSAIKAPRDIANFLLEVVIAQGLGAQKVRELALRANEGLRASGIFTNDERVALVYSPYGSAELEYQTRPVAVVAAPPAVPTPAPAAKIAVLSAPAVETAKPAVPALPKSAAGPTGKAVAAVQPKKEKKISFLVASELTLPHTARQVLQGPMPRLTFGTASIADEEDIFPTRPLSDPIAEFTPNPWAGLVSRLERVGKRCVAIAAARYARRVLKIGNDEPREFERFAQPAAPLGQPCEYSHAIGPITRTEWRRRQALRNKRLERAQIAQDLSLAREKRRHVPPAVRDAATYQRWRALIFYMSQARKGLLESAGYSQPGCIGQLLRSDKDTVPESVYLLTQLHPDTFARYRNDSRTVYVRVSPYAAGFNHISASPFPASHPLPLSDVMRLYSGVPFYTTPSLQSVVSAVPLQADDVYRSLFEDGANINVSSAADSLFSQIQNSALGATNSSVYWAHSNRYATGTYALNSAAGPQPASVVLHNYPIGNAFVTYENPVRGIAANDDRHRLAKLSRATFHNFTANGMNFQTAAPQMASAMIDAAHQNIANLLSTRTDHANSSNAWLFDRLTRSFIATSQGATVRPTLTRNGAFSPAAIDSTTVWPFEGLPPDISQPVAANNAVRSPLKWATTSMALRYTNVVQHYSSGTTGDRELPAIFFPFTDLPNFTPAQISEALCALSATRTSNLGLQPYADGMQHAAAAGINDAPALCFLPTERDTRNKVLAAGYFHPVATNAGPTADDVNKEGCLTVVGAASASSPRSYLYAMALLLSLGCTKEEFLSGVNSAVRASFCSFSDAYSSGSLLLSERIDRTIFNEQDVAAVVYARLLTIETNEPLISNGTGGTIPARHPLFASRLDSIAHSDLGQLLDRAGNGPAIARPNNAGTRHDNLVTQLGLDPLTFPAYGTVGIPNDVELAEASSLRHLAEHYVGTLHNIALTANGSYYGLDAEWWDFFQNYDLTSLDSFKNELARLTNDELERLMMWLSDGDFRMTGDRAFTDRWDAAAIDLLSPLSLTLHRNTPGTISDAIKNRLYVPNYLCSTITGLEERRLYTCCPNIHRLAAFVKNDAGKGIFDPMTAHLSVLLVHTTAAPMFKTLFHRAVSLRACADYATMHTALTPELLSRTRSAAMFNNTALDNLAPQLGDLLFGISEETLLSSYTERLAAFASRYGLSDTLASELHLGLNRVKFLDNFLKCPTELAYVPPTALHELIFEHALPGLSLTKMVRKSKVMATLSVHTVHSQAVSTRFQLGQTAAQLSLLEYYRYMRTTLARAGQGMKLRSRVEVTDHRAGGTALEFFLNNDVSGLGMRFPRKPDAFGYTNNYSSDLFCKQIFPFNVFIITPDAPLRDNAHGDLDVLNPRCSFGAPVVPITNTEYTIATSVAPHAPGRLYNYSTALSSLDYYFESAFANRMPPRHSQFYIADSVVRSFVGKTLTHLLRGVTTSVPTNYAVRVAADNRDPAHPVPAYIRNTTRSFPIGLSFSDSDSLLVLSRNADGSVTQYSDGARPAAGFTATRSPTIRTGRYADTQSEALQGKIAAAQVASHVTRLATIASRVNTFLRATFHPLYDVPATIRATQSIEWGVYVSKQITSAISRDRFSAADAGVPTSKLELEPTHVPIPPSIRENEVKVPTVLPSEPKTVTSEASPTNAPSVTDDPPIKAAAVSVPAVNASDASSSTGGPSLSIGLQSPPDSPRLAPTDKSDFIPGSN
jgi:hypothetical protein